MNSPRAGEQGPTPRRAGLAFYLSRGPSLIVRGLFEPGAFAHAAHRLTGLVICAYLLAHIIVIGQAAFNEQGFDSLMRTFHRPLFLLLDLLLFGAVAFHGLNGCRLMLHDLSIGLRHQGRLVWVVTAATFSLMGWGLWALWPELT
ncbi:MAG: hypothetical protein FJ313_04985 [Gemmatimonadetes bacterium]|nr:hypothetical protein [Gemmatimonadota bacterium]